MLEFLKNLIPGDAFALYITDTHIQALQLDKDSQGLKVKAIGEKKFKPGVVENGAILQERGLAEGILQFLQEVSPDPIETKKCAVALPEDQSFEYVYVLDANLQGKDFDVELERQIEETIPVPLHELKYDYHVSVKDNVQIVFVVAVRREIIAQYYEVLKNYCGLTPVLLEPASLSLLRNIPLNFNEIERFILVDDKDGEIVWFSFWGKDIVDSNTILRADFDEDSSVLISDMDRSRMLYKELTGGDFTHILVSDAATHFNEVLSVCELPVVPVEKYKFLPHAFIDESSDFSVISGLALQTVGLDAGIEINLLKKL